MSRSKQQSSIAEARDQLFLDTADGVRLNVVTSNLGLDRPLVGLGDDEWRAVAKAVALQPKLVPNIFYRIMGVLVGPQKARKGLLSVAPVAGETIVQLDDASDLIQIGNLIFSPGLAEEETVGFCFRDLETNKVFLTGALANAHNILEDAESELVADTAATAGSLVVRDSSVFPTTGFPYPIIVGRGTDEQETLVVTANTTATNTLTLSVATAVDHSGPKVKFVRKALQTAAIAGRDFIQLDNNATRVFPATGWIRINFGGGTEEVVEYTANNITTDVLTLKTPLANAHAVGESVELVDPGVTVETLSVLQTGVDWEIFETEPRKIKVFIPEDPDGLRLLDASYWHDATPPAAASTLSVATTATTTVITLAATAGFPEAGLVSIGGSVTIAYALKDDGTNTITLAREVGAVFAIGTAVTLVTVAYPGTDLDEGNLRTSAGVVSPNKFTGPYLYDELQRAPGPNIQTTLTEVIPPPTTVAVSQTAGHTNLEVEDAGLFPAPPFTPFSVRLGRTSGAQEDRTLVDRTLQTDAATTVNALTGAGSSTLPGADTTTFPESDGLNPAGYRIIVDRGGAAEEILTVNQNTAGTPGTFAINGVTANAHAGGETIELLKDVLTFDVLQENHPGPSFNPTQLGHKVEKITTTLALTLGTSFPLSGTVYLNFGKGRINVRQKIASVVGPTILQFADSSVFPTTNFPYRIKVGEGLPQEEFANVTGNNTGLNQLTLSAALSGTFAAGQYVEFDAGEPIALDYIDRDGNTLDLDGEQVLQSLYTLGENVMLSPGFSIPSEAGTDYAFLLPPTSEAALQLLFDLVRAAGVQICFLSDR